MTIQTCLTLLEAYKKQAEAPLNNSGGPLTGDDRKHAIEQSKKNVEMMTAHILGSRKFKGHQILKELQEKPKSEEKEDDKKPKG